MEQVHRRKAHEKGNEEKNMSTSIVESSRVTARTGKAERRLARAATIAGAITSFSALALSSAQYYKVSSAGLLVLSPPAVSGGALVIWHALFATALWVFVGIVAVAKGRQFFRQPLRRPVA
jgi:hypothetical protein